MMLRIATILSLAALAVAPACTRDRSDPEETQKVIEETRDDVNEARSDIEEKFVLNCRYGGWDEARARKAIALQPARPEGHFWLAANMGALAESFGMSQGLKYRKAIKAELEDVLRLDAAYEAGSADRALGRWYFKVPGLFGGSNEKSEQHLRKSLTYDPQSSASWYFLAETLEDMGRRTEARAALQHVVDAPLNPEWAPEDRRWKALAKGRLAKLAR